MGNVSPIGDAEKSRLEELTKTILTTFAKEFALATPLAVLKVAKEENPRGRKDLPLKLDKAPVPSEVLKSGRMMKSDPDGGSWKERYFVAYNKADNYKVEYFDGEDEKSGTKKGTIFCESYRVQDFNAEDKEKFGGDGFKLVPWWYADRRRTWNFKCLDGPEKEKEMKAWKEVFELACRNSKSPTEVDRVTGIAFNIALNRTRWESGVWGWYCWYGSETERLIEFIYQILEREVLRAAFDKFDAPSFVRHRAIAMVQQSVRNAVSSACKPAIQTALEASKPVMATVRETIEKGLDPIFDAEHDLKTKIVALVTDTAKPALATVGDKVMGPLLSKMFGAVTNGFTAAASGWHTKMTERANEEYKDFDEFDSKCIKYTERYLDYWWSENVLSDALYALYEMRSDSNPLYQYRDLLPNSYSFYEFYWDSRERLQDVTRSACYTLRAAKPQTKEERVAAVREVTAKYLHDLKIVERDLLIQLLKSVIDDTVDETVTRPALKLVSPVADAIGALPEPIKMLFDVNALVREVIDGIVFGAVAVLVDAGIEQVYHAIDKQASQIGVPAVPMDK